jgi:hypothetical protein
MTPVMACVLDSSSPAAAPALKPTTSAIGLFPDKPAAIAALAEALRGSLMNGIGGRQKNAGRARTRAGRGTDMSNLLQRATVRKTNHYCRNPHCCSKLARPVETERQAFCYLVGGRSRRHLAKLSPQAIGGEL